MADTTSPIKQAQTVDVNGNVVVNATNAVKIAGSATTTIEGTADTELDMVSLVIYVPVASGTFHFTDAAGAAITGLPDATNKAATDYAGAYPFFRFKVTNGLKIVTASATGLVATMFYSKK
jgi:hypothetical protein